MLEVLDTDTELEKDEAADVFGDVEVKWLLEVKAMLEPEMVAEMVDCTLDSDTEDCALELPEVAECEVAEEI